MPPRDSSFSRSPIPACDTSAGASPNKTVVSSVTPARKPRIGRLVPASRKSGSEASIAVGIAATSALTPHRAPRNPTAAPITESKTLSVSNCENNCARVAPSADRIANSLRRPTERVIMRLATLAHAIKRTKPTAPKSISSNGWILPTILWRKVPMATKVESSSFGYSRANCAVMPSISA